MSLAGRIERRLKAKGLRRAKASDLAGLGKTYVRDVIEGRVRNPRTEHLARLAGVLGTTLEWLAEGRGEEEPSLEQLHFERIQALLHRIAPEDLPNAERALRGFVRDETPATPFEADTPAPKARKP